MSNETRIEKGASIARTSQSEKNRTIAEVVSVAKRKKAEGGWYPGRKLPLGYEFEKQPTENGGIKYVVGVSPNKKLVALVQREFQLAASGLSPRSIRVKILSEGFLEPHNFNGYRPSHIVQRLRDRFYVGVFVWEGLEYEGGHQTFISREIFDAVQAALVHLSAKSGPTARTER